MTKKILVIIIIFLAIIGGLFLYAQSTSNQLKVGHSVIEIPEGYTVLQTSEHGGVITNNGTNITILENVNTTKESADNYIKLHKKDLVKNSTEKVGNVTIYKFVLMDNSTKKTKITHLFYDKDGVPYHIHIRGDYDPNLIQNMILNQTK